MFLFKVSLCSVGRLLDEYHSVGVGTDLCDFLTFHLIVNMVNIIPDKHQEPY